MRALALLACCVTILLSPPAKAEGTVAIGFLTQVRPPSRPVSPLDREIHDERLAGARLGLADTSTTGRFTGQRFTLAKTTLQAGDDPARAAGALEAQGIRFVVADLDAPALQAVAAAPEARDLIILNSRAPDDALRGEECRANLVHVIRSRAMLADGLAQYLASKRWRRWFLVIGSEPGDKLLAEAFRRAAKRFGAGIVAEKEWAFRFGGARSDTGHVTLQTEIPTFTQGPDHDVLVVADETGGFEEYLPGRTARPRPVAGTHGLIPVGFSEVLDRWGAAQSHARFEKMAGRRMGAIDYAAWAAVHAVGEAALRTRGSDPGTVAAPLRGPDFLLAGFKGQGQSFRPWDGQMRQPILIAGPRVLVSVSPQPGFLHRGSELDTLGIDRGESRCRF